MLRSTLLALIATSIVVLIAIPSIYAYAEEDLGTEHATFEYSDMTFTVIDEDDVELTGISESISGTLTVPDKAIHGERTYNVVGIRSTYMINDLITHLVLPASMEYVSGNLSVLESLETIEVDADNDHLIDIDGVLYDFYTTTIIAYPVNKPDTSYSILDTVTTISEYCFMDAYNLESITMPDIVSIIDRNAFDFCLQLKHLNHRDGVNHLPSKLKIIGESAFDNCSMLTDVELPEGLMMIGAYAFNGCESFTSMHIPETVISIGSCFLGACPNVKSITISDYNLEYACWDGVLYNIQNSSNTLSLHTYPGGREATSFTIPSDVGAIEPLAFKGTMHLKKLSLSDSMLSVSTYALFGCESLEQVYIPSSVVSIDHMAFFGCESLKTIKGGKNVSYIWSMAFASTGLTKAFLPPNLEVIGSYAFKSCLGITELTVSETIQVLDLGAFSDCRNITSITILGVNTQLYETSLSIGNEDHPVEVDVHIQEGVTIPGDVFGEYTEAHIMVIGEEPYPYENLIGVAICLFILFLIIRLFREV